METNDQETPGAVAIVDHDPIGDPGRCNRFFHNPWGGGLCCGEVGHDGPCGDLHIQGYVDENGVHHETSRQIVQPIYLLNPGPVSGRTTRSQDMRP